MEIRYQYFEHIIPQKIRAILSFLPQFHSIFRKACLIVSVFFTSFSVCQAQVTKEWENSFAGSGSTNNVLRKLVVDAIGNSYITGAVSTGPASLESDFITVKYDPSGNEVWARTYNGTGNGLDIANDIATDANGNIYVTGNSFNGTNYDYTTIKYDKDGVLQWLKAHNGTGNKDDFARSIEVDAAGYVYVSGNSHNGTNEDYTTIKYNEAGTVEWVANFNGAADKDDQVYALAIDASGNVYVSGQSMNASENEDFATVKYNASGVQQWASIYDGNGSGNDYGPRALAVDGNGNVYISGQSDNGPNEDYTTIKYDASGQLQWVNTLNGAGNGEDMPTALGVDASGNVYVTGRSDYSQDFSLRDFTTVKYNAGGEELWVKTYSGSVTGADNIADLALDSKGNIYVSGQAHNGTNAVLATIRYNPAGEQDWVQVFDGFTKGNDPGNSLTIDKIGNVYVSVTSYSGGRNRIATVKYSQIALYYEDADEDGYGNPDVFVETAYPEAGYVLNSDDCDDTDASSFGYSDKAGSCNTGNNLINALSSDEGTMLKAEPNPFQTYTDLNFTLTKGGYFQAALLDMKGSLVQVLEEGNGLAGRHYNVKLAANDLPAGIYLVRLVTADEVKHLKVMLNK